MPFQIDRTKTAAANFLGLVNQHSIGGAVFTGNEFTTGNPVNQTPSDPQEQTNAEVVLTAVTAQGFTGTKTVRYRRLTLGNTHPGAAISYSITGADTLTSIKTAIAIAHNLVESDFTLSGVLPVQGAGANTFTCTAIANSLLYTGSFQVQVTRP